jgi:hypothetical protein
VKELDTPHVGGHQINRSVEDVFIQCAVATFANEHGADLLKSQRDVGATPHLEIIFEQGQLSIPSHYAVRLLSSVWIIAREFLADSQRVIAACENRASTSPRRTN